MSEQIILNVIDHPEDVSMEEDPKSIGDVEEVARGGRGSSY